MTVIRSKDELKDKLEAASNVSPDHPVVISKFIEGAEEIDVDAVAANGQLIVHAISEHVEVSLQGMRYIFLKHKKRVLLTTRF